MAKITIDGIKLSVPDEKNILDCALESGIYIPHLCHHPNLPENGSCRMCIVEVEGVKGVVPSCTLKAEDGLQINTKSNQLMKLRSLALDLLLAGHPEDCSTCPKYGSCELQTLIQYMGGASQRMRHRVKGFKSWEDNPLLEHDMNRCILCGRCVRACRDLRGVNILDYKKKDLETYIGTIHDKLLIDEDCRFCQACAEVCPTGTIRDTFLLNREGESKEDAVVPCRAACPAHTDVPRYISFAKAGKYDEAAAVIREKVPFPKTLGHICNHLCESDCKRGVVNDPMSIRNIKRYVAYADTGLLWKNSRKQLPDTNKKICVVGGGPAGMTAAYYLCKQGHDVTLKETLPTVGGMMSYGIPKYRLPREVVEEEYQAMEEMGIHTELGVRVEEPRKLKEEFDAVLMAIGTHQGVRLPIDGSELPGVLINTEFLRKTSLEEETGMGRRIIVLGGGNVAFDCARTAIRLGAKEVHLACLENREQMTADEEEIIQAIEEGVVIHPGQTFERITGEEAVTGVDFMKVKSFTFDQNKRAIIEKEIGSELHISGDTVIFATGQKPDITEKAGLPLGRGNTIVVDPKTLATEVEGIFAAGDAIYGTKSVIEAIASGRKAAEAIDQYLGQDGDISEILAPNQERNPYIGKKSGFGYEKRKEAKISDVDQRVQNFNQMDFGIQDTDIQEETCRCLQCDLRLNITAPRLWGDYEGTEEVKA